MTLRDEIDVKLPGAAKAAKTAPRRAIRLFCPECMGGSRQDAETCQTTECRLWPFGTAAYKQGLATAKQPRSSSQPSAVSLANLRPAGRG